MQAQFKVGSFAIILDEQNRVLLCHRRDRDLWNLPGGKMEKDESPWAAVIREVKEEVGLDVAIARLSGVYSKPENSEIVFAFVCRSIGGFLRTTAEADRVEYFAIKKIPEKISPRQRERITDAIEKKGEPILKIQFSSSN